jgi:type I restriction enzyme S subunit
MSDVPEGYRMSEVGVIPEDWEVKSLENIGLFKKGKNIPKKDLISEGVPCVLYGEIYTEYNFTSNKLNSFIPHAIAQQSTSINKGDILFAGSGETAEEIGKCFTYLGDEKACAGGDINIFCPLNDDSTFLGYLLNSVQVNKQKSNLGQGSSVVHIYSSSLKTILIPLPLLPEQQAIASALNDVDALITALEQSSSPKSAISNRAPCSSSSQARNACRGLVGSGKLKSWEILRKYKEVHHRDRLNHLFGMIQKAKWVGFVYRM